MISTTQVQDYMIDMARYNVVHSSSHPIGHISPLGL